MWDALRTICKLETCLSSPAHLLSLPNRVSLVVFHWEPSMPACKTARNVGAEIRSGSVASLDRVTCAAMEMKTHIVAECWQTVSIAQVGFRGMRGLTNLSSAHLSATFPYSAKKQKL